VCVTDQLDTRTGLGEALVLRLPGAPDSVPVARHAVTDVARGAGASEHVVRRMKLAVTEAVSNAILHANPGGPVGVVTLDVAVEAGEVVVRIEDEGHGVRARSDSPGLGLGIRLMHETADRVRIGRAAGGGAAVELRFELQQGSSRR
jgi:serine/threonine-protein kinase RsbW